MVLQRKVSIFLCRAVLALVLSCLAANGFAVESFRVASLNAEWLWTPNDGRVDGSRFNKGDMSTAAYKKELGFYAASIKEHGVELLALSEIESELVAEDLANLLGDSWLVSFRQGRDTATGQDVAILSKIGVRKNVTDFGFPAGEVDGFKPKRLSKVVGLVLEVEGRQLGVATSHFLSKRKESPKKAAQRLMQAKALIKAHDSFGPLDAAILMGDFNDYRSSPVLKTMEREANMKNVLVDCQSEDIKENKRYMIDHILFRGLSCVNVFTVDTQEFSDHPMVIAEFEFAD